MKKNKKTMIGIILLAVGVIGAFGIPASKDKTALIVGVIGLVIAGAVLLFLGIKQSKAAVKQPPVFSTPATGTSPAVLPVDGSKSVEMLPAFQGDLIKVYQYTEQLCVIRDEPSLLSYIQSKVNEGLRQIEFEFEPENSFDDRAIIIKLDGKKIGYVYRGQTQDMINDFYYSKYEIAGHINTFAEEKITYKIAFYKPKTKCRIHTVSFKNKKFSENTYEGEMLTVEYDGFDDCFKINALGEEYILPKKAEEYANKHFDIPVEVGENCESLIFYK